MTREELIKHLHEALDFVDIHFPYRYLFVEAIEALSQPSLSSNLDEAAKDSWSVYEYRESPRGLYSTCYVDGFKAGAEWMAGQWIAVIGMAIEALSRKEGRPRVMWRRIDKSPDFTESGEQLENGVKLYKRNNAHIVLGLSKDGVLSWLCNHADSYRGDGYYLTFNDLLSLQKEDDKDYPAESEDESTKELSKAEVGDILIREQAICENALDTFGIEHQVDKCIEECAELINALEKYRRGRALPPEVVTEIADVMITCAQMSIVFGRVAVVHEEARKLKRLEKRIERAKNRAKSGDKEQND